MSENFEKLNTAQQKDRIRERYRGIDPTGIHMIPALPTATLHEFVGEKKVAVYVRVSTDDPRQTSSYELQKNHYQDMVSQHPGWYLTNIYADEGISGTSLKHRDAFVQMIADCREGKIDLIITKGVARFARNVVDCIGYVRELCGLKPPVGVLFETENIYTLNSNYEMSLAFIATLMQEESHSKSEVMNSSIEMRFRRGIVLTPPLLGYNLDEDGMLIINEEEAKTVHLIFFMYLYGYTTAKIAEMLTQLGRRTKAGNLVWSASSVLNVLQNERHCGDVLARKTWTPNYLDHKARKNKQDRNQYHIKEHHEPIVSRDDFIAVQRLISNAKYGNKGFLPELQVIAEGVLKGFVPVNPRWAGFKEKDYWQACESLGEIKPDGVVEVHVKAGEFDLRGYQVARAQFFDTVPKTSASFSNSNIYFSSECIKKFPKVQYVELLVHPQKCLLAVRPSTKENRRAIHWANQENKTCTSRTIGTTAFSPTLYALFGWSSECKYRVRGIRYAKAEDTILVFDMKETEVFIPVNKPASQESADEITTSQLEQTGVSSIMGGKKSLLAYPIDWGDDFGSDFYQQEQQKKEIYSLGEYPWLAGQMGRAISASSELNVSSGEAISGAIDRLIDDMSKEKYDE